MRVTKRTPENVAAAREMESAGVPRKEICERFGISESTLRMWLSDEVYQRHTQNALNWQKKNAKLVNKRNRVRVKNLSREEKDRRNAKQRERYVNDPRMKETLNRLMAKYRNTGQGAVATLVRRSALGFCGKMGPTHKAFMESASGMSMSEYVAKLGGDGHIDHIVPLCAFDLTNPEHLVRAVHHTNTRLVPRRENEMKGKKHEEGLDVMSLPWSGNPDALVQARNLIARRLARLSLEEQLESRSPLM